jgi:hypothetical protein
MLGFPLLLRDQPMNVALLLPGLMAYPRGSCERECTHKAFRAFYLRVADWLDAAARLIPVLGPMAVGEAGREPLPEQCAAWCWATHAWAVLVPVRGAARLPAGFPAWLMGRARAVEGGSARCWAARLGSAALPPMPTPTPRRAPGAGAAAASAAPCAAGGG